MISRVIGVRYEVLERTGEGALFQVFKARDKVVNRVVALKTLQPEVASDGALASAVRSSATELAGLVHPNIARVYEAAEEEGVPFLVTEFVRGINLKERIRRIAPFTPWVAVDFAIAIAEAVHHAHGHGVLHGDLRPQNIIVSPEGSVKVTDFGSARILASSPHAASLAVGRAAPYRAPEGSAGQPAAAPADLYALGAIIFEMLTGGVPYPGETALIIADRHQADPVPSPRGLNPGVPRALEGIVMRALQKRPEDRYRSAADILGDLKQVRDGLRFGKSLSWSPMESAPAAVAAPMGAPSSSPVRAQSTAAVRVAPSPEPADAPDAGLQSSSSGGIRMVAPERDDRVPPLLMFLLKAFSLLALVAIVVLVALFMATMSRPPAQVMPSLVGMKIEQARQAATKVNARLMEHEEYSDQDEGTVFRVDPDLAGRPVRAGRSINVWISRGSRMVWVPNLRNASKDDADTKLKAAGLHLGAVNREYNDKYPYDYVVAQNPRAGKRVNRDTEVNLIISDGPNLEATSTSAGGTGQTAEGNGAGVGPDSGTGSDAGGSGGTADDTQMRSFPLEISVKRDGLGLRRVKVEYDDAMGTHIPFDEMHAEGDVLKQTVDVVGSRMTVRVYYGDPPQLRNERTFPLGRGRAR